MYESNFEQINAIQNLVNTYLKVGELAKIDVLTQIPAPLIEESFIESNMKARCEIGLYSGNYQTILREVQSDIAKNIATLNSKELFQLEEAINFFVSKYCSNKLERHVEHTIELLSYEKRQLLSLFLRLCTLCKIDFLPRVFELEDFCKICNLVLDIQEEDADKCLVGTGLINKYLFDSKNITALHYDITLWGMNSINRFAQNPAEYEIPEFTYHELKEAMSHTHTKPFIEWILKRNNRVTSGNIEYAEWDEGKHAFDNNYGNGAFENTLVRLVKAGAITIESYSARKSRGYHIRINPEALTLLS